MMSKRNGGVAPGSGKTQCKGIGEFLNREVERVGWKNRGTEEGLWDLWEVGPRKGKIICNLNKKNISKKDK